MATGKIVDLRRLLAERFPHEQLPVAGQLLTGVEAFDKATAGGLTKSAITELSSGSPSAGSASLIALLVERAACERYFITLIDGRDSFDASSVSPLALRHLLWVRCRKASEAMRAADLLLRDGNFPLVILDLFLNAPDELRKIPQTTWYRLQRLVEPAPTAFLVLTPRSMISSAQFKLVLENCWTLADLDRKKAQLHSRWQFRLQRAQPNKWKNEQRLAEVG